MLYEDLNVGMKLICHQSNGTDKELFVARKGIDGFGKESVVFQSVSSSAQFYCREEEVPYYRIEPINMSWKDELEKILEKGCTDSDIEDFADEHPEVNGRDIWDYVYEYSAPDGCKGCKYIQMAGMAPCIKCSRRVKLKDYYESR